MAVPGVAAPSAATEVSFSSSDLRRVLGAFATGVTVITSRAGDHAYGMTANAFSSLSLDPPLVLVCVIRGTAGAETIERNKAFAVNILAADQEPVSRYFSWRDRPRGADAFNEILHDTAVTDCPVLEGVAGFLDCRLADSHEAGDHVIFIGEVVAIGVHVEAEPLLFHHGRYARVWRETHG